MLASACQAALLLDGYEEEEEGGEGGQLPLVGGLCRHVSLAIAAHMELLPLLQQLHQTHVGEGGEEVREFWVPPDSLAAILTPGEGEEKGGGCGGRVIHRELNSLGQVSNITYYFLYKCIYIYIHITYTGTNFTRF